MQNKQYEIRPGNSHPFGYHYNSDGANFCIFSRYATQVELLLFRAAEDKEPFQGCAFE